MSSKNEIVPNEFFTLLGEALQTARNLQLKLRPSIMPGPLPRSCLEVRPTPMASREQSTKTIRPPTSPLQRQRRLPHLIRLGRRLNSPAEPGGRQRQPAAASPPQHNHLSLFPQSMGQNATRALFHVAFPPVLKPYHHHLLYTHGPAARQ